MKKKLLALALTSLFIVGAVQAEDHSATVSISGTVTPDNIACNVTTDTSSLALTGQISSLPNQGDRSTNATELTWSLSDASCWGKVELQLKGQADDADGTSLANTDSGEGAAKGIGIGLFNTDKTPIQVNNNQISPIGGVTGKIALQLVRLNSQTPPTAGTVHGSLTIDVVRL